jgi:hypothetical protein
MAKTRSTSKPRSADGKAASPPPTSTSSTSSTKSTKSTKSTASNSSEASEIGARGRFAFSTNCHQKRWTADGFVDKAISLLNNDALSDVDSRNQARDELKKHIDAVREARAHEQKNINQLNQCSDNNSDDAKRAIAAVTETSNNLAAAAISGVRTSNKNLGMRGTGCCFKTVNLSALAINWGMAFSVLMALMVFIDRQNARKIARQSNSDNSSRTLCIPAVPPSSVPFYPAIATAAAATGGDIFRKDFLTAPIAARLAGQFCHAFEDATGTSSSPPLVVDVSSNCQQCEERTESSKTSRLGILSCRAQGHFGHYFSHYNRDNFN